MCSFGNDIETVSHFLHSPNYTHEGWFLLHKIQYIEPTYHFNRKQQPDCQTVIKSCDPGNMFYLMFLMT